MTEPRDPPSGGPEQQDAAPDPVEEAARVRRSVAETIARVRKLTAGIGAPSPEADVKEDAAPAATSPEADSPLDDDDHGHEHRLTDDVTALVDHTREVIARTRRLLDKSRRESSQRKGE